MVAKRIYELNGAGTLSGDLTFPLDNANIPEAVSASLDQLRTWVHDEVDAQLSTALLSSINFLDVGGSVSFIPNSDQGILVIFDRDTAGRAGVFHFRVGVDPFIEPITMSAIDGVPEWNPVSGPPPVVLNTIGLGASIDGTITLSNGFPDPLNLVVTPGRASTIGEMTIANLDQLPLLAPTSQSTVVLEDRGQGFRMSLADLAAYLRTL
jgi:hypothetical protein